MAQSINLLNPIPSIDWINNAKLISREPGVQIHPITGKYAGHAGIDIKTPVGTQILSPADNGIVTKVGWDLKFVDGKKVATSMAKSGNAILGFALNRATGDSDFIV